MTRDYRLYLDDMVEAINRIDEYTKDISLQDFLGDKKTRDAVIKNFGVMGEAANNIPLELRNDYPDLPWQSMVGMRNKLVHEYFGIDLEVVWKTIKKHLPELKEDVIEIIDELGS